MKMYVDELPKNCWQCPCFKNDLECSCGLDEEDKGYFLDEIDGGECPLKSTKDLQKQMKDEITNFVKSKMKQQYDPYNDCFSGKYLIDVELLFKFLKKYEVTE